MPIFLLTEGFKSLISSVSVGLHCIHHQIIVISFLSHLAAFEFLTYMLGRGVQVGAGGEINAVKSGPLDIKESLFQNAAVLWPTT